MFKIVEGGVPAGENGRIDLFVKRDERSGEVVGQWDDVVNRAGSGPRRVRRVVSSDRPIDEAFAAAVALAKSEDVPLCVYDPDHIFPKGQRPQL